MRCPNCGAKMHHETRDEVLRYKGQSMTLHKCSGDFCAACGEGVWDEASYRRVTEAQKALIRAVDGNPSEDVRRLRKQLKMTQAELAEVFGVGKVAFSRYERGETTPPAPVLKLLRLIAKHPELLDEVRKETTRPSDASA